MHRAAKSLRAFAAFSFAPATKGARRLPLISFKPTVLLEVDETELDHASARIHIDGEPEERDDSKTRKSVMYLDDGIVRCLPGRLRR